MKDTKISHGKRCSQRILANSFFQIVASPENLEKYNQNYAPESIILKIAQSTGKF